MFEPLFGFEPPLAARALIYLFLIGGSIATIVFIVRGGVLRRLITGTLSAVLEIASAGIILFTTLIGLFWPGIGGAVTAAAGFVIGLLFIAVVFGVVFVLLDIERHSRHTAQKMEQLAEAVSKIAAHTSNLDVSIGRLDKAQVHNGSVKAVADELARRQ
jgi:hypothetical protein